MSLLDTLYQSRYYQLNDEQRVAADDDAHSLIVVGAGAGTGKTKTLVARYLRLLLTEVERKNERTGINAGIGAPARADVASERYHPLDRILAITYTNAAADEMRARIEVALRDLGLLGLARQMDRAQISTFHGFCTRVLRRHALEAGVDPGFRVLDEDEERACLQRDSFEETLAEYFSADRATLMRLLRFYPQSRLRSACFRLASETAKTGVAISDLQPESFALADIEAGCPPLPVVEDILKFAQAWRQRYDALKHASGAYDFDDLLLKCRSALAQPRILESYHAQFIEALLDEAQDTNDLQLALFNDLSRRQFIVGDSKQSIYRFQGADVGVFGRLLDRANRPEQRESVYYPLLRNYRSREEILTKVNELFATEALLGIGLEALTIGDPQSQRLPEDADSPAAVKVAALTPDATAGDAPRADTSELRRRIACQEAEWIAQQLFTLLAPAPQRPSCEPVWRPGDAVILVAKRRFGKVIAEALKGRGLKSRIIGADDFLEQPVIADARALLAALRNPDDDAAFLRALLSRLGRVSDQGLYELAQESRATDSTLWRAACGGPRNISDPADDENLRQTVVMLGDAFSCLGAAPLSEIIARAFSQRGVDQIIRATEQDAAQSFADLRYLCRIADGVQEVGGGLTELIATLDEKEELGAKFSSPAVSEDADDVVRIMTIHASKGLQFPIVAVACAQDVDAVAASRASVFVRPGPAPRLGLKYTPEGEAKAKMTPTAQEVIEADREAETFEKKRQLYVACTRAMQVLLLSFRRDAKEASISGALARAFEQRAGNANEGETPC